MGEVSVVVNCHREGILVHRTLRSVKAAILFAKRESLSCQIVIALDRADAVTYDVAERFRKENEDIDIVFLRLDYGDLGLSRNAAVKQSYGKFIAFVDGDDLISENWLLEGFKFLRDNPGTVAHPKVNVFFDRDPHWWFHIDDQSSDFSISKLYSHNYWTALSYGPKELYLKFPYQSCPRDSAFGYEDWHWNCEVISGGFSHKVVEGTTHFIRLKTSGSLNASCAAKSAILRPTKLFLDKSHFNSVESFAISNVLFDRERYFLKTVLKLWLEAFKFTFVKPARYLLKKFGISIQGSNLFSVKVVGNHDLPSWSYEHLVRCAFFEPLLFPSKLLMRKLRFRQYHSNNFPVIAIYSKVLSSVDTSREYSHILVVPWLIKGGADLGIIHHVNALAENFGKRCLVITTENRDSVWLTRLSPEVDVLELGRIAVGVSSELIRGILTRLLLDLSPDVLHVVNSKIGWEVIQKFGLSLKEYMSIFVSCFCDDYSSENEPVGYAREYLPHCYSSITTVFSDQMHYPRELARTYGYPMSLFRALYFPTEAPEVFAFKRGAKVLWAGRVDRQKRPDILVKIASCMPDVVFEIWGTIASGIEDAVDLEACKNIIVKGAYGSFSEIPTRDYGVFLYTSQWDGLPNVLLEVAASGLPIVSSMVGGIAELVSERTGYPVVERENPRAYVERINQVFADEVEAYDRALAAYSVVKERHSKSNWITQLEKENEYLSNYF